MVTYRRVEFEQRIRSGAIVDHLDTVCVHKEGHLLTVSLATSPILGEHGAVIGLSVIAHDIEEDKRQLHRAQFMQSQLAAIVQSSQDAIFSKNVDGSLRTWNAGIDMIS